jgi:hypothetical protein
VYFTELPGFLLPALAIIQFSLYNLGIMPGYFESIGMRFDDSPQEQAARAARANNRNGFNGHVPAESPAPTAPPAQEETAATPTPCPMPEPEVVRSGRITDPKACITDEEYAEAMVFAMQELGPDIGEEEVKALGELVINPTFNEATGEYGKPVDPRIHLEVDIYADNVEDWDKVRDMSDPKMYREGRGPSNLQTPPAGSQPIIPAL